ncbi:hypothetical protein KSX_52250 [Ktedonospora formicarum]|uniref:DinB family protein n=1 Tax=Ktedonospora formicarum TaxID=2778364 RepID=A0A8J3I6R9_9CHLR|nr:NIPSNAP family protein [Ktedonospora formicarum]GHO47062.1 hypothetical protein KSX_52250 [Ktedonospora formicarum]
MITCYLRYVIDPYKVTDFETYARLWIPLVNRFGGTHHGYFLPHEGANNIAFALFSFPSLTAYEIYRERILTDEECQAAFAFAETTRCILSYERTFLRPVFEGESRNAEQIQWAAQLREIPQTFRNALRAGDEQIFRHRPAAGEWSAIEVVGHMIDKMSHWSRRVERIAYEKRPTLPGYDQDAEVLEHGYQQADPAVLFEDLQQQCERFAALVAALPSSALPREGIHGEYGPMTLQQCIQAPLESVAEHIEQLHTAQQVALAEHAEE